jgi:hypothetical protein
MISGRTFASAILRRRASSCGVHRLPRPDDAIGPDRLFLFV